ncbi:hypothetical protein H0H93_004298, partial [Arthromyces matolae]
LFDSLRAEWTDEQLPWNKAEGAVGSPSNAELRSLAAYVYLRRYYSDKHLRYTHQGQNRNSGKTDYTWVTSEKKHQLVKQELKDATRKELQHTMDLLWPWIKENRRVPRRIPEAVEGDFTNAEKQEYKELYDSLSFDCADEQLPWNKEVAEGGWSNDRVLNFIAYVYLKRLNMERRHSQMDTVSKKDSYGWVTKAGEHIRVKKELENASRGVLQKRMRLLLSWIKEHRAIMITKDQLAQCWKIYRPLVITDCADKQLPWNKEVAEGGWSNDQLRLFIPFVYFRRSNRRENSSGNSLNVPAQIDGMSRNEYYGWTVSRTRYKAVIRELEDVDSRSKDEAIVSLDKG